eukprot:gene20429-24469_t
MAAEVPLTDLEVVEEAWKVIEENFMPTRGRNFDPAEWEELLKQARASAYRELARELGTPKQFTLELGTPKQFTRELGTPKQFTRELRTPKQFTRELGTP